MEKTPQFSIVRQAVEAQSRKLSVRWTTSHADSIGYKPYELTEEEKESLSPEEQETWKVLKTTEILDLESEIMNIMSSEITKEIDAEILKGLLSGTSTK
jgi:hypothetical protein